MAAVPSPKMAAGAVSPPGQDGGRGEPRSGRLAELVWLGEGRGLPPLDSLPHRKPSYPFPKLPVPFQHPRSFPSERESPLPAYPQILGSLVPWCLSCLWVSVGWVWVGLSRGLAPGGLLCREHPRLRSAAAPVYFLISRPLTLCHSSGAADCGYQRVSLLLPTP